MLSATSDSGTELEVHQRAPLNGSRAQEQTVWWLRVYRQVGEERLLGCAVSN